MNNTRPFFPITTEKLNIFIDDSWVLYAAGSSQHAIGARVTLELQSGKPVARVTVAEKLVHQGDIDFALKLFNQNVKHG